MKKLLTFEKFADDYYIVLGEALYGRITDMGDNNFWIRWEDDEIKVPEHGLENAMSYAQNNYQNHTPIY